MESGRVASLQITRKSPDPGAAERVFFRNLVVV